MLLTKLELKHFTCKPLSKLSVLLMVIFVQIADIKMHIKNIFLIAPKNFQRNSEIVQNSDKIQYGKTKSVGQVKLDN